MLKESPKNSKETKRIHNSSGLEKEDRMFKERQIQENDETGRIPDWRFRVLFKRLEMS